MKKIRIPQERAYYLASPNETDRLLCWIPADDYDHLVCEGRLSPSVPDDYPDGLEVEVSPSGFDEFEVDLGVSPEAIKRAYADLAERDLLPPSGIAAGPQLETMARDFEDRGPDELALRGRDFGAEESDEQFPEPAMTEGEDPMVVMRELE